MRRRSLLLLTIWLLLGALAGGNIHALPAAQDSLLQAFVFDTRVDLETLATAALGSDRPDTWTGNTDVTSPTVIADLWFDNEQLADALFGAGVRPSGWSGATGANPDAVARSVRHDLELAADEHFGVGARPDDWRGAQPLLRCGRTLQNVVDLLGRLYNVRPTTVESALDYCATAASEIADRFADAVYSPEQQAQLPDFILAVRGDLERLADEKFGLNNRPPGWIGNRDRASTTLIGDNFLDLETLADELLGEGIRPTGWIGAVSNAAATSFLNMRHDLELLADETLGFNERPNGWQGTDPILRCEPMVQNLVLLAQQNFNFAPQLDTAAPDYCGQLEAAANQIAENPPVLDVVEEEGEERLRAESNFAFAYLDVRALQYMGIMPGGTEFRAWYRNFGGSNMMFVSGDDFALYVDFRFTTLPVTVFDSLPTLENVSPLSFCDASWCNGPGPTPTPTGFGPLAAVLNQATAPAPVPTSFREEVTKTQVSWNNIRVFYLLDNAQARTAQVTLEICVQPAQVATACESVNSVTDLATNTVQQPVTQYNGLNVYEFRYGYTTNLRIEGETLFSNDIWISDPTIR